MLDWHGLGVLLLNVLILVYLVIVDNLLVGFVNGGVTVFLVVVDIVVVTGGFVGTFFLGPFRKKNSSLIIYSKFKSYFVLNELMYTIERLYPFNIIFM